MKRLTLFRHAKSSWDDGGLADHDRPLASRGLRDAPRMGERLAQRGLEPELLLTSSARRARMTAELIAPRLADGKPRIVVEPRIYLASPGELLAVIADVDDRIDEIVLVGHNPGLTDLANRLLPEFELGNLPTAGAVAIECDADRWSEVDAGPMRLRCYDFPKNRAPVPQAP